MRVYLDYHQAVEHEILASYDEYREKVIDILVAKHPMRIIDLCDMLTTVEDPRSPQKAKSAALRLVDEGVLSVGYDYKLRIS